jgi:hypothetical protein
LSDSWKYLVRGIITVVTLFFDFWICYFCLYSPLRFLFIKADQPWKSPPDGPLAIVDFGTIGLLLLLDFFLFYRFKRLPWTFFLAPAFTLLLIGGFVGIGVTSDPPNTTIDSTGNGCHYRTEVWFERPGGKKEYKRWKTKEPYDGTTNPDELRYRVDSSWFTKDDE